MLSFYTDGTYISEQVSALLLHSKSEQAYMPMASGRGRVEMYQKGRLPSVFAPSPRPMSQASDSYETEFEDDDMSDLEEYTGRKSEDSVSCITIPFPAFI